MWDREELQGALKVILTDKGGFVCLLDGYRTGKSLKLNSFEKLDMDEEFVADLRSHDGDIPRGLLADIDARRNYYIQLRENRMAAVKFGKTVATILTKNKLILVVIDELISSLTQIVDNGGIDRRAEAVIKGRHDLALLTRLTKQSRKVRIFT